MARSVFLIVLSLLFTMFSTPRVEARWGSAKDANLKCLRNNVAFKVDKSGQWTMESEINLEILTENGRRDASVQTLNYDASREHIEILEAYTTSPDGKSFVVQKASIEDKPLASDPLGVKNDHQILVPFQQATVGSTVHLKYKQRCFKPTMENYFADTMQLCDHLWNHMNFTIESELPLLFKVNDPGKHLHLVSTKKGNKHLIQISLTKPLYEALVGESNAAYVDPETRTYVSLSTETDYQRVGKFFGAKYHPISSQPLPPSLEAIRKLASQITDEKDCLDTIVAHLIKNISYLGSWNSAEGQHIPRSLEAITRTGFGDCKEYSICLSAILNALGYTSNVALVARGDHYIETNRQPGLSDFNHAIVKVVSPSGKTYWIDPTNATAMADGTYPDIADRPALVLHPKNPTYERIPPVNHSHAICEHAQTITLKDEGAIETSGQLCHKGECAAPLTAFIVGSPPSVVQEVLQKAICNTADPVNFTLRLPPNVSPKVQVLTSDYGYEAENNLSLTNCGYAFPLESMWAEPYVEASHTHEGGLLLDHPQTKVRKLFFPGVQAMNPESLAFSIKTPWLNASRELLVSDEGVTIIETVQQIKSIIPAKDIKSEKFKHLIKTLRKYCKSVSLILSRPSANPHGLVGNS
jgi:hypothetical protein